MQYVWAYLRPSPNSYLRPHSNQVHYLWALQQREDLTDETPEAERWQVTELAVRGMMSTY